MRNGVYAANLTPFQANGDYTIDLPAYRRHVTWLAEQGVAGVAPFGTNGEGPSVTVDEKITVVEALVRDDPGIDVLPVLTEGNLPDTLRLIRRVNDLPVCGVLVLPPYYFKAPADEGLRIFYERVLETSQHPVLVYHHPRYAVPVPADLVASLPLWGVKNSAGEPAYSAAVRASGRQVMVGTETDLAHDLLDAFGCISALANIVPRQMVEMWQRVRTGDTEGAAPLAAHLREVSALTRQHDSPGVLKALAQARSGIPMGTVRPPLLAPPAGYDVDAALARLAFDPAPAL